MHGLDLIVIYYVSPVLLNFYADMFYIARSYIRRHGCSLW